MNPPEISRLPSGSSTRRVIDPPLGPAPGSKPLSTGPSAEIRAIPTRARIGSSARYPDRPLKVPATTRAPSGWRARSIASGETPAGAYARHDFPMEPSGSSSSTIRVPPSSVVPNRPAIRIAPFGGTNRVHAFEGHAGSGQGAVHGSVGKDPSETGAG